MIEYSYFLSYNIYFSDIALDNQLLGVSVMHQLKAHTISHNKEAKALSFTLTAIKTCLPIAIQINSET